MPVHQAAGDARMDDHDRHIIGNKDVGHFQAAAIDQQRMVGLALRRNQLIHDAALRADKIALRFLRDLREAAVVDVDTVKRQIGLAHRHRERGR